MDLLWTPWRFAYVTTADGAPRPGLPASLNAWPGDNGCVFCNLVASVDYAIANGMSVDKAEEAGGIVLRGKHCFICLNAYPYTSGHVMVVPFAHLDRLAGLPTDAAHEMMDLAQQTEKVLHALPRWVGDTNFMTTVSETRVLPESLSTTWMRMREALGLVRSSEF